MMADATSIEWTDTSWNPLRAIADLRPTVGWACQKISPGCENCYAAKVNQRLGTGLGYDARGIARSTHYLDGRALNMPLTLKRPRRIFLASMTDIFGEWVHDEDLDRIFAVMALTPQHTYQVLTKRPERMREYMTAERHGLPSEGHVELAKDLLSTERWGIGQFLGTWPLPNVWLGTSVENQHWADIRIPELLATPAAVRFVSCEPLLEEVWLTRDLVWAPTPCPGGCGCVRPEDPAAHDCGCDEGCCSEEFNYRRPDLNWIIVGGESGHGARPFDVAWARSAVEQCRAAGVAVYVKQLGARPYTSDMAGMAFPFHVRRTTGPVGLSPTAIGVTLRDLKGGDPDEWPADLNVREFPQ